MSQNQQTSKLYIEPILYDKDTGEIKIRPIARKLLGWPEHPDKPTDEESRVGE